MLTDWSPEPRQRSIAGHLNEQFSEVLALEKTDEGRGCVLQAQDNILPDLDLVLLDPIAHRDGEFAPARTVVLHRDETLHGDALAQQYAFQQAQSIGPRGQGDGVVRGDEPAHRDTGFGVQQWQDSVENGTPYVLEIDVDALRARRGEACGQIGTTAIDAMVEAQRIDHVPAFVLPAIPTTRQPLIFAI